ncbi:MAG: hypothetical protein QF903_07585 [Planctomycetota bacterium]|jgi:hypothetical protein|nr:hypothetical protein [Planctomycetota bacterium]MDP6761928.1 hypothetical protein [Planctomycetota bacterium]MDP6989327.1 hypothetical protein [Planctomycetota bacterium]
MIHRRLAESSRALAALCACSLSFSIASALPQAGGDEVDEALRKLETEADSVWEFLSSAYDADEDGTITYAEYARTKEAFERLDLDGSGTLTREDFSRGGAQGGGGRRARGERGRAGRGGRGEGRGRSGREGRRTARARSPKEGAPAPDFDLVVLEKPAEKPGDASKPAGGKERKEPAQPGGDGEKEGRDDKKPETVKLSSFKGAKAVVLIFGSYT